MELSFWGNIGRRAPTQALEFGNTTDGPIRRSLTHVDPGVLDSRGAGTQLAISTERGFLMDEDRIAGKKKEIEGETQQKWGEAKDKARDVWEDVKDSSEDAADKAEDVYEDAIDGDSERETDQEAAAR
ncbi:MAG: CsbD family protein [Gaiellaceae bacterium]